METAILLICEYPWDSSQLMMLQAVTTRDEDTLDMLERMEFATNAYAAAEQLKCFLDVGRQIEIVANSRYDIRQLFDCAAGFRTWLDLEYIHGADRCVVINATSISFVLCDGNCREYKLYPFDRRIFENTMALANTL